MDNRRAAGQGTLARTPRGGMKDIGVTPMRGGLCPGRTGMGIPWPVDLEERREVTGIWPSFISCWRQQAGLAA